MGLVLPTKINLLRLKRDCIFTDLEFVVGWINTMTNVVMNCERFKSMQGIGMPRLESLRITDHSRTAEDYLKSVYHKMPRLKLLAVTPVSLNSILYIPPSVRVLDARGGLFKLAQIVGGESLTDILCTEHLGFTQLPASFASIILINKVDFKQKSFCGIPGMSAHSVRGDMGQSIPSGLSELKLDGTAPLSDTYGFTGRTCLSVTGHLVEQLQNVAGRLQISFTFEILRIDLSNCSVLKMVPIQGRLSGFNTTLTTLVLLGSLASQWPFLFDAKDKFPVLESVELRRLLAERKDDKTRPICGMCIDAVMPPSLKKLIIGNTESRVPYIEDPRRYLVAAVTEGIAAHGAPKLSVVEFVPFMELEPSVMFFNLVHRPGVVVTVRTSRGNYPLSSLSHF